jgi:alpha-beta hydrolase superfamily lysophospholipase
MPFNAAMCTRDMKYREAMDTDAREHRLATPRLLWAVRKAQKHIRFSREVLPVPVLFLHAGMDQFYDMKVNRDFYRVVRAPDKTVIEYPDMSHALTIDMGREKVFEDVAAWLGKRI